MKVGFIGIGQMGRRMSRRILEAGYDLTVHDIDREAASSVLGKGAKWADSPKNLARSCELIFSSLPTPQIVEEVVYGVNGLKSGWKKGDIYIDMSTNSPSTVRRIAEDAQKMDVSVLDAPVSGAVQGAEAGTLTIMVGGELAVLEKVRKILETMGKKIFPVGGVGCGNIAKLVNNFISISNNAIASEGFVLGAKAGMDPQVLWEIIRVSSGNSWTLEQLPGGIFKRNFEPGFKLGLARKDMSLALSLGEEIGVPLTVGAAVQQLMNTSVEAGYSEKSIQAVILPIEEKAGVKVSTP
jgi:2-hydroxymethylglutarate dehydrogenase